MAGAMACRRVGSDRNILGIMGLAGSPKVVTARRNTRAALGRLFIIISLVQTPYHIVAPAFLDKFQGKSRSGHRLVSLLRIFLANFARNLPSRPYAFSTPGSQSRGVGL
jgi:hypothetical protein